MSRPEYFIYFEEILHHLFHQPDQYACLTHADYSRILEVLYLRRSSILLPELSDTFTCLSTKYSV